MAKKKAQVKSRPAVIVYTDGSYRGNTGRGGWAAILQTHNDDLIISGTVDGTTNNQMEMYALYRALCHITEPADVTIYSDSQYVLNGLFSWRRTWHRRKWVNSAGKPVSNKDLWLRIYKEADRMHSMKGIWVRGHTGQTPLNTLVDELAQYRSLPDECQPDRITSPPATFPL